LSEDSVAEDTWLKTSSSVCTGCCFFRRRVDFWDDATDAAPGDGCEMVNKWLFDGDDDGMFAADADAAAYDERLVETKQQPPLAHRGTQGSKNVVTKEKAFRPKGPQRCDV
jgi:hypothetical protein